MRTLLLDADILAYKAAAVNEESFDFNEDGSTAVLIDEARCYRECDRMVGEIRDVLDGDHVVICLSDPDANWRKELEPTYKKARLTVKRPALLKPAKAYLADAYTSYTRDRLEADDVMGILGTSPTLIRGERIMVSQDKDLLTVPGLHYDPDRPEVGITEIDALNADRLHMYQTITGDTVDGYCGCPKAGPAAAEGVLEADREDLWDYVLFEYCSRGHTENDAIHQARLAHILRCTDYNYTTKRVKLWSPLWLF